MKDVVENFAVLVGDGGDGSGRGGWWGGE